MTSTVCHICTTKTVRIKGEACQGCRIAAGAAVESRGRPPAPLSVPATDAEVVVLPMEASEPRAIVEKSLRQAAVMQARVDAVMADPRPLLCVECLENPAAIEGVNLVQVLDAMVKLGKILAGNIPVWQKLDKEAKEAADQMSREEMAEYLVEWFARQVVSVQRDVLQQMQGVFDDAMKRPMLSILGSKGGS